MSLTKAEKRVNLGLAEVDTKACRRALMHRKMPHKHSLCVLLALLPSLPLLLLCTSPFNSCPID